MEINSAAADSASASATNVVAICMQGVCFNCIEDASTSAMLTGKDISGAAILSSFVLQ
jgi:hypothetical protein